MSHRTTILLVDDSLADMRLLIEMLASKDFRIVVAFDGGDGYRKAILNRPEMVLLDVKMPNVDGFAACRLLKADPKTRQIPVIFLTAADDTEQRIEGFSLGAVDYVVKPFSEREVLARVSLHLDIARRLAGTDAEHPVPKQPDAAPPAGVLVRAAIAHLAERLTDPPSPGELARALGTNETKLNQEFQREMGMPVFAYVREERLRLARQFLASTDIPVKAIGEHVGYPNPANFATAFRARFGMSPRDYRQSLRDQQTAASLDGSS